MKHLIFLLFFLVSCCGGCHTTHSQKNGNMSQDELQALQIMAESVVNQDIDEKQIKEINKEMQKNPQTKSAVENIANALSPGAKGVVYCPVDGERFAPYLKECPTHHVPLKALEE